jgi:hypothetical protein
MADHQSIRDTKISLQVLGHGAQDHSELRRVWCVVGSDSLLSYLMKRDNNSKRALSVGPTDNC